MRVLLLLLSTWIFLLAQDHSDQTFVDVNAFIPNIDYEIRYYGNNNFIGQPIQGYKAPLCLLTPEATTALQKVQQALTKEHLSLKVFDCYRPQRAVNHFIKWANDLNDTKMKSQYYPHVKKEELFEKGYIAAKSGHSRGSTVDLTIKGLDMGTPFDLFDTRSHTYNQQITPQQLQNRIKLKSVMERYGFKNYPKEWWHYTLEDEPYQEHYFDLVITK